MNVLPVIEREMRVQARLGFTYVLRVLGVVALMLVCLYGWLSNQFTPRAGPVLFGNLNCALLVTIWWLVPLMAADCLSRERREGTLGLLFLTPLKPSEIVLAKALVHGLRAVTLWLSVLPVLTISFLIGGVTWREAVLSGLINFSSICFALAAGILASSVSKQWLRALLLAGGLAFCFATVLMAACGLTLLTIYKAPMLGRSFPLMDNLVSTGFGAMTDMGGLWGIMFGALSRANQRNWLLAQAGVAAFSFLSLLASIVISAFGVRRSWQEEPPSARRLWLQQIFTTPIIGVGFFHRWLKHKLERNPIGWLEQRTWTGRLVTWGWFAVMISFYIAVFQVPNSLRLVESLQVFMGWGLLLIMAVSASGSFQRERETRVLELLLVSPMTAGQIIEGRLRGLWGQFLPSLALLMAVWVYLAQLFRTHARFDLLPFFCGGFLTLPVIGLYYSLRRIHFINALLSTLFVGLLMPHVLRLMCSLAIQLFLWSDDYQSGFYNLINGSLSSPFFINVLQVAIAVLIGIKLHRDLVHRNFAYSKNPG